MHQHRRAFIGAMMQKSHNAGIVEILFADVIADLRRPGARRACSA